MGKISQDRAEMNSFANERRKKFGSDYWCKKALESLHADNIVITSIRNPAEADVINSKGGRIVEIAADQKTRFERTIARVKKTTLKRMEMLKALRISRQGRT